MFLEKVKTHGSRIAGATAALPLVLAGSAHAALPAGIETAITDAGADLKTAGVAVVVAMVAFWAIKKVGTKLGFW